MIDEYKSRGVDLGILPDIMPGLIATGALLKHCFPEEFTDTQGQLERYREREIESGTYMYYESPDGKLDSVQI